MEFSRFVVYSIVLVFQQLLVQTLPTTKNPWAINDETPSHVRPIRLYSKQGHYVAISKDGTVTLTRNQSSEDAILEMHSYNVNMKRIKRPGSNLWLSIGKKGNIRTRDSKFKKDTLFHEHDDGMWLWYESKRGYVLAFRRNLRPKHRVTKETVIENEKNKYSKFLIMKLAPIQVKEQK